MTRRITLCVLVALLIVAFFSVILTIQATTNIIGKRQETKVKDLLEILYYTYKELGSSFIDTFETEDYNITLLSPEGEILNHEFEDSWYLVTDKNAISQFLEDVKKEKETIVSTSTSFLFGNLVLAGISTLDGTVLVASTTLRTFGDTLNDIRLELLYIILVSVLLSSFLARLISYIIVLPLNEIDVEEPSQIHAKKYKEILPLINKISEQKESIFQQEKKLYEEQTRFRTISEALLEGMIFIEADKTISYINRSAIKILELENNPEGANYIDIFDNTLKEIVDNTIKAYPQKAVIYHQSKAYQVETEHILLPNGKYNGVAILLYDITERLALEADRRAFTANVSHELKTPLHIILGSAELLEIGIIKDEDKASFIHQIYNETKRMSLLVDDIIRLSKLDESKEKIEKEVLSVKDTAASVMESLAHIATKEDISLLLTGENVYVKCNRSMFSQILYNLIDNAIKYSNKGGKVIINTKQDKGNTIIDIRDNGIGIPKEYHEKIFERFFRVDKSRSQSVGGTGLGLAIVKASCLENGGTVRVESSVIGEGTTFRLTFPSPEEGEI